MYEPKQMEILREKEERLLAMILEREPNSSQQISSKDCEESTLVQLEKSGYITIHDKSVVYGGAFIAIIQATEDGKNYFSDKKEMLEFDKREKQTNKINKAASVVAYLITTGIAIAALVVSIMK